MEYNYSLRFCRFASRPITSLPCASTRPAVDASPLKLLHALRELAIHADKQDDLLIDDSAPCTPWTTCPERKFGDRKSRQVRIPLRADQIGTRADGQADPDPNKFPGGYAYLLLALALRLDYLLRP
jgi:hypothetical protein